MLRLNKREKPLRYPFNIRFGTNHFDVYADCALSRDSEKHLAVRMRQVELQLCIVKRGRQLGLSSSTVAKVHVRWRHIQITAKQHP